MKCFYHPTVDAVAICKNCGKGLCAESLVDFGNGVACKNGCEAEVEAIIKVFQQSKRAFENYRKAYSQVAVWVAILGVGFLISALFLSKTAGLLIFSGLAFLIGAIITYIGGRRYNAK